MSDTPVNTSTGKVSSSHFFLPMTGKLMRGRQQLLGKLEGNCPSRTSKSRLPRPMKCALRSFGLGYASLIAGAARQSIGPSRLHTDKTRSAIPMHTLSPARTLKELSPLSVATKVEELSNPSERVSPMSKSATTSSRFTPLNAESANSAKLDIL